MLSAWGEIHHVFGDGSNDAWALEDENECNKEIQQQKLDMKYTNVRQPSQASLYDSLIFP